MLQTPETVEDKKHQSSYRDMLLLYFLICFVNKIFTYSLIIRTSDICTDFK